MEQFDGFVKAKLQEAEPGVFMAEQAFAEYERVYRKPKDSRRYRWLLLLLLLIPLAYFWWWQPGSPGKKTILPAEPAMPQTRVEPATPGNNQNAETEKSATEPANRMETGNARSDKPITVHPATPAFKKETRQIQLGENTKPQTNMPAATGNLPPVATAKKDSAKNKTPEADTLYIVW